MYPRIWQGKKQVLKINAFWTFISIIENKWLRKAITIFCRGEETFSFCNDVVAFGIFHDIYPFAFDIVLRDGAVSFDDIFKGREKNVNEILDVNKEYIKSLSPIEIVDYYAELVANNINILEKAFKWQLFYEGKPKSKAHLSKQ